MPQTITANLDELQPIHGVRLEDLQPVQGVSLDQLSPVQPAKTAAPTPPPWMPQDAGLRGPLTMGEKARNLWESAKEKGLELLPAAGAGIGAAAGAGSTWGLGTAVGAGIGGAAGKSAENLLRAWGVGPTPPPETVLGNVGEVAKAGLLSGAGQYLLEGAFSPYKPPTYPLPRPVITSSVRDMTDGLGKTANIHVEDTFRNTVGKAMDPLKRSERLLNTTVRDIRDAKEVASHASQQAWAPYQQLLNATSSPITRDELLAEADRQLPAALKGSQARSYRTIQSRWNQNLGQQEYSSNEIEQAAQADNARLKNLYKKDNIDRAAAEKDPTYAGDEAMLRARRSLLDQRIKADTGYDAAPLREQYGHIKAVNNALLKSPSEDDTLWHVFRSSDIPLTPQEAAGTARKFFTKSTPDKLVARAFKNHVEPPMAPGLIPSGWQPAESQPFTGPVVGSQGMQPQQTPIRGQLYAQTAQARQAGIPMPPPPEPPPAELMGRPMKQIGTGQKLLPGPGETTYPEVETPKSLLDIQRETFMPESRISRQQAAAATAQPRPANAQAYLKQLAGKPLAREHILADSNFQMLSDGERLKVMHELDPTWRKLEPKERWKVISEPPRPVEAATPPPRPPQDYPRYSGSGR